MTETTPPASSPLPITRFEYTVLAETDRRDLLQASIGARERQLFQANLDLTAIGAQLRVMRATNGEDPALPAVAGEAQRLTTLIASIIEAIAALKEMSTA